MSKVFVNLKKIVLLSALSLTACSSLQVVKPVSVAPQGNNPLIGTWHSEIRAGCYDTSTFNVEGTKPFTENQEVGESRYTVSGSPSTQGYYTLVDTVTKDNGKPDCSGSSTPIGDRVMLYVWINPNNKDEARFCIKESLDSCFIHSFRWH